MHLAPNAQSPEPTEEPPAAAPAASSTRFESSSPPQSALSRSLSRISRPVNSGVSQNLMRLKKDEEPTTHQCSATASGYGRIASSRAGPPDPF